jgi:hypothetical protein
MRLCERSEAIHRPAAQLAVNWGNPQHWIASLRSR